MKVLAPALSHFLAWRFGLPILDRQRRTCKRLSSLALFDFVACASLLFCGPARADSVADFYKGKTVTIQVGYGPGGGYDLTSRLIAQFLGDHIPGKPKVVVQNVPGAGSMTVANAIYNNTPKDGLTLGVFAFDVALAPFYGEARAMFDPSKYSWIGSMDTDNQYCAVWKGAGAGIKTLPGLVAAKRIVSFGSSAPGAVPSEYPLFFKNALGAPVTVINGYTGTKDIFLAMRRGEVDGTCGLFESQLLSSYMDDIKAGDLGIFMQSSLDKVSPLFPDASSIMTVLKTDEMRAIARLVFGPATITRPLAAPPGIPEERLHALRKALFDTVDDKLTLAAAAKMSMKLQPKASDDIERLIASFQDAAPDTLSKAYALMHE